MYSVQYLVALGGPPTVPSQADREEILITAGQCFHWGRHSGASTLLRIFASSLPTDIAQRDFELSLLTYLEGQELGLVLKAAWNT